VAAGKGKVLAMAQTTERFVIRRALRLTEDRHLIFDRDDGLWRVSFYRPRRKFDQEHHLNWKLQTELELDGMLTKQVRGFWYRTTGKGLRLSDVIFDVLYRGANSHMHPDVITYIEGMDYAWYLET
jgi:hypothetical protein